MPEAPECAVCVDFLNGFTGFVILEVEYTSAWIDRELPIIEIGSGITFEGAQSVGKHIFLFFSGDLNIECKLGMTCCWALGKTSNTLISFLLGDENGGVKQFFLNGDVADVALAWRMVSSEYVTTLPPCILAEPGMITLDFMRAAAKKHSRKGLCSFLLDQSIMSGVGNYIKCEVIFKCRLDPKMKMGDITDEQLDLLRKAILSTVKTSYKLGGFSIKDYYQPNGQSGMYIPIVYGRTVFHDPSNGKKYDVKKEMIADRITYYVDWTVSH